MVFVVDAAGVREDLGLEPFPRFRCWCQTETEVGEIGQLKERFWWERPLHLSPSSLKQWRVAGICEDQSNIASLIDSVLMQASFPTHQPYHDLTQLRLPSKS